MIKVVKQILENVGDSDIIVSSTGVPSRVLYNVKDRPLNFYVQGSMGASLGIGIGLAMNVDREVHVIAGDGDILMSLGTMALAKKMALPNLHLHILDNNCYCATGGQTTCSDSIDFRHIFDCQVHYVSKEKPDIGRIQLTPIEIRERFQNAISV